MRDQQEEDQGNILIEDTNLLQGRNQDKDQMAIDVNKYREQDFVGRETIDLINKEAEVSEIDASHFNKTDRFEKQHMMTED